MVREGCFGSRDEGNKRISIIKMLVSNVILCTMIFYERVYILTL